MRPSLLQFCCVGGHDPCMLVASSHGFHSDPSCILDSSILYPRRGLGEVMPRLLGAVGVVDCVYGKPSAEANSKDGWERDAAILGQTPPVEPGAAATAIRPTLSVAEPRGDDSGMAVRSDTTG